MALKPLKLSILGHTINEHKSTAEPDTDPVPSCLLPEIMSGVPAKTVFSGMAVSKSWRIAMNCPFFKRHHFSMSKVCPLLIVNQILFKIMPSPILMHLLEGETEFDLDPQTGNRRLASRIEMCKNVSSMRAQLFNSYMRFNNKATTCEGLVCSAAQRHTDGRDHVIICNPVTREYAVVNLVQFAYNDHQNTLSVFIGLGFSRADKRYKLLRVTKNKIPSSGENKWSPELFVIGKAEGWQRIEKSFSCSSIDFGRKVEDVIYVDGVIYWSYLSDGFICYFDFDNDMLEALALPDMNMNMGVLEGYLCASYFCHYNDNLSVWRLEKDGQGKKKWIELLNIDTRDTLTPRDCMWSWGSYTVVKYLESGKILLHIWYDMFLIYNPDTNTCTKFCGLGFPYVNELLNTCSTFQMVAHVPCIVPLAERLNIDEDSNITVVKEYNQRGVKRSQETMRRLEEPFTALMAPGGSQ